MSRIAKFFGLEDAPEATLRIARIMVILLPAFAMFFQLSTSFWMITIAESLGGGDYYAGLVFVGFLVIIQLVVQTLLDYPTGALGDHIGHRYTIASALLCYAAAFWITSIVDETSPFYMFVLIYALMGFGASQESGSFNAWFDNNYRVANPEDTDRKQYGVFIGKTGMLFQVTSTLVLIPGSWLAILIARQWVFQVQAVMCVILAMVVLKVIRDLPGVKEQAESATLSEYWTLLKDGVKFLFSDRFIIFITLGEVLIWATGTLWWTIMLFPLYYSYLFTEVAVSSYRTMVFLPEAVVQERSGIWSRRFEPAKWIPRFRFLQFCGFVFYLSLSLIMFAFPPLPEAGETITLLIPFTNLALIEMPVYSVLPLVLIFILFVVTEAFAGLSNILTQRVMIDIIPNRIRNSMYSLKPTLSVLLSIPLIGVFSWMSTEIGLAWPLALVSLVSLAGALMIRHGFGYPIPRIEAVTKATDDERSEIEGLEVT